MYEVITLRGDGPGQELVVLERDDNRAVTVEVDGQPSTLDAARGLLNEKHAAAFASFIAGESFATGEQVAP